jgi:ketosteroid isomerase-like protein
MILKKIILLIVFFPVCILAQEPKLKEEVQKIIETEKAFAKASTEKGTKVAFQEFLAKESIIFDKNMPVNGSEFWQNTDFKGILDWQLSTVEIAGSGDLAYTTGNWQHHNETISDKPAVSGSFLSLWKKQNDGTWKVVLDVGITQPSMAIGNITENYPTFKPAELKNQVVLAERMVFMNDHFYWKNAKTSLNPFEPHLSQNIKLFRKDQKPILGKENAKMFLKKSYDKSIVYTGLKAISSNAGDLVCVYGVISGGGKSGSYVRIWKQEAKDSWKIVVEMVEI